MASNGEFLTARLSRRGRGFGRHGGTERGAELVGPRRCPRHRALPVLSGLGPALHQTPSGWARIERARQLMAAWQRSTPLVLANDTASSSYFADLRAGRRRAAVGAGHSAKGRTFLVCPAFEEAARGRRLDAGPFWQGRRGRRLAGGRKPLCRAGKGLKDRGPHRWPRRPGREHEFVFSEGYSRRQPAT